MLFLSGTYLNRLMAKRLSQTTLLVLHIDIDIVSMRTAHQRHEITSEITRSDAANEHPVLPPVLPPQGHLLHELLGLVVVDRHQAVFEINEQVVELVPQAGQDSRSNLFFGPHRPEWLDDFINPIVE